MPKYLTQPAGRRADRSPGPPEIGPRDLPRHPTPGLRRRRPLTRVAGARVKGVARSPATRRSTRWSRSVTAVMKHEICR